MNGGKTEVAPVQSAQLLLDASRTQIALAAQFYAPVLFLGEDLLLRAVLRPSALRDEPSFCLAPPSGAIAAQPLA